MPEKPCTQGIIEITGSDPVVSEDVVIEFAYAVLAGYAGIFSEVVLDKAIAGNRHQAIHIDPVIVGVLCKSSRAAIDKIRPGSQPCF